MLLMKTFALFSPFLNWLPFLSCVWVGWEGTVLILKWDILALGSPLRKLWSVHSATHPKEWVKKGTAEWKWKKN